MVVAEKAQSFGGTRGFLELWGMADDPEKLNWAGGGQKAEGGGTLGEKIRRAGAGGLEMKDFPLHLL